MSALKTRAAPFNAPLAYLMALDPSTLEGMVEILIAIMDAKTSDAEAEDSDEDCCEGGDDIGSKDSRSRTFSRPPILGYAAGDPDDAEEDDAAEDDDPAEADNAESPMPAYRWVERYTATEIVGTPERARASPLFGRTGR